MKEHLYIGSSPAGEECAQVGAANYFELSKLELAAFQKALIAKFGEPPEGAYFRVKEGQVVIFYNDEDQKQVDYAYNCEGDGPETWAEVGMSAPRLDDPAFTETELMEVPEGMKPALFSETACVLKGNPGQSRNCAGDFKNEYIDAALPGLGGSWGLVCPACASQHGARFGTGLGQRFKKAKDGKFYKVEG